MKSYNRLFLPRVRSNSLSTLAVVPSPSSTSRPVRLPSEGPKQLALTQPTPGLHPTLFPCTPPLSPNPVPAYSSAAIPTYASDVPRAAKRQRLKYQLDVGAYGIPKHRRSHSRSTYPNTALSVQVGEDAYFVRDNAMGIADGVGGWSKCTPQTAHPTPSALFARRLMHFCSAEIDALGRTSLDFESPESTIRPPATQFSFQHHLRPRTSFVPPKPQSLGQYTQSSLSELEDSLSSSLEELSEGIDVLHILERAYDSTVKAHTAPTSPSTPLHTGSSTALVAVLDHPFSTGTPLPQNPEAPERNYAAGSIHLTHAPSVSTTPASHTPSTTHKTAIDPISKAAEILAKGSFPKSTDAHPGPALQVDADPEESTKRFDAVLRIAHLGDCMGMLVRGEEIVWRSDEMWWGYNHPLQLGPPSVGSSTSPAPSSSAATSTPPLPVQPHTFTLPVCADDILILASDGLSDNLWDEDVLDEVIKFRRAGGFDAFSSSPPSVSSTPFSTSSSSGSSSPFPFDSPTLSFANIDEAFTNLSLDHEMPSTSQGHLLRRKAFAGMLSEALCSRAKRVSEGKRSPTSGSKSRGRTSRNNRTHTEPKFSVIPEEEAGDTGIGLVTSQEPEIKASENPEHDENEVPFGMRARLAGKVFHGGKPDDISVIVAVISPSTLSTSSAPPRSTLPLRGPHVPL